MDFYNYEITSARGSHFEKMFGKTADKIETSTYWRRLLTFGRSEGKATQQSQRTKNSANHLIGECSKYKRNPTRLINSAGASWEFFVIYLESNWKVKKS